MVVGLLAMLFIIVSAYITLARYDRAALAQTQKREQVQQILAGIENVVLNAIRDQLADDKGQILAGGGANKNYIDVDVPGFRGSSYLSSLEPVRHSPLDPTATSDGWIMDFRWPGLTQFTSPKVVIVPTGGAGLPQPTPLSAPRTVEMAWRYFPQATGQTFNGDGTWGWRPSLLADRNLPTTVPLGSSANWLDRLDSAFSPYMDADGDGMIDSYMPGQALIIEMANAQVGVPLRTPSVTTFDPTPQVQGGLSLPLNFGVSWINEARALMNRFDAQARYVPSVRVVSHGGMVPLLPGFLPNPTAADLSFSQIMFQWLRSLQDNPNPAAPLNATDAVELNRLAQDATAVEPLLRRRAGLPEYWGVQNQRPASYTNPTAPPQIPASLRAVELRFPYTLLGLASGRAAGAYTQYDVGQLLDLRSWQLANHVQASVWNRDALFSPGAPAGYPLTSGTSTSLTLASYDRRHVLTTMSSSDELARVQSPVPVAQSMGRGLAPTAANGLPAGSSVLGLPAGAPKFFLGEIEKCFNAAGVYQPAVGNEIIPRLASYFYDMLSGHRWDAAVHNAPRWNSTFVPTGDRGERTIVTRWEQAFMLAVNTVAFAAPRDASRFVDVVYYTDSIGNSISPTGTPVAPVTSPRTYVGYGPQPFITRVIAYGEDDDPDDGSGIEASEVALGIELYNPNDPDFVGATDNHALPLEQFAITLGEDSVPVTPLLLRFDAGAGAASFSGAAPNPRLLNGRSFVRLGIFTTANTRYNAAGPVDFAVSAPGDSIPSSPLPTADPNDPTPSVIPDGDFITVNLWRRGTVGDPNLPGIWFKVDEMKVRFPDVDPSADEYTTVAMRDMNTDPFFGASPPAWDAQPRTNFAGHTPVNAAEGRPARWRCVTAFHPADDGYWPDLGDLSSTLPSVWGSFPPDGQDAQFGSATRFIAGGRQPTVPLLLMTTEANPAVRPVFAFGAQRPNAFPTVGFMHLIPRYSHTAPVVAGIPGYHSMSEWLRQDWALKGYEPGEWPADFGHMPVFDHKQQARGASTATNDSDDSLWTDSRLGFVPWGMLIHDYFSTHNVSDPPRDSYAPRFAYENPLSVKGRININNAPWYTLAGLPMLVESIPAAYPVPTRVLNVDPTTPQSFRGAEAGTLFGAANPATAAINYPSLQIPVPVLGTVTLRFDDQRRLLRAGPWRFGPSLAQAAVAYRDRVPLYFDDPTIAAPANGPGIPYAWMRDSTPYGSLRFGDVDELAEVYKTSTGSAMRKGPGQTGITGQEASVDPQYGFVTVGEMLNAAGMAHDRDPVSIYRAGAANPGIGIYSLAGQTQWPLTAANTPVGPGPDYLKAISYLMFLDTHFVTTRSNTFTIYTSLLSNDPEKPQESIRTQVTVDRSNTLPQAVYGPYALPDGTPAYGIVAVQHQQTAKPQVLSRREIGYYNTQFDN